MSQQSFERRRFDSMQHLSGLLGLLLVEYVCGHSTGLCFRSTDVVKHFLLPKKTEVC